MNDMNSNPISPNNAKQRPPHISLFDIMRRELADDVRVVLCNKATLVHISHTLEDVVLSNQLPALMFTGFQESSHWRKETERYQQLANVAQQVCIFAGKPLPDDGQARAIQIELSGEDPLRQEWFVIIMCDAFSALLCGKDNLKPTVDEGLREFETILTFEPRALNRALDRIEEILALYRPDVLLQLRDARQKYPVPGVDISLTSLVMSEMLNFETLITGQLRHMRDDLAASNQQLRLERDFTRTILDTSPALMLTLNPQHQIVGMNRVTADKLYDGDTKAGEGQTFWDTWIISEDRETCYASLREMLAQHRSVTFRARLQLPTADTQPETAADTENSAHLLPVEWHCHIVPMSADEPLYIFAMGIDASDRDRATALQEQERVLRAELEKEQELSAVRDQLMSTISHEFRTPLATILSSSEMLERYFEKLSSEARKRRIETIKEQIAHLTAMVEDVSTVVRTNQKGLQDRPEPLDLLTLTRNIVSDIEALQRGGRKVVFTHQWRRAFVMLDKRLYKHILGNLLTNALKYSDDAVFVHLSERDGQLVVEVRDQGIGISEADAKRIFEPFYRGSNTTGIGGTGIGLRILQDAVKACEGSISFESTLGEGSTFTVKLPLVVG
jgi:signal transduction histidine kinase/DICT domain-containing protein